MSLPAVQSNEGDDGWASCKPTTAAAMTATPATSTDTHATTHIYTSYNNGLCPDGVVRLDRIIPFSAVISHTCWIFLVPIDELSGEPTIPPNVPDVPLRWLDADVADTDAHTKTQTL